MSSPDLSSLIQQLENVSKNPPQDDGVRRDVAAALRAAYAALESPLEAVQRISFSPLQLVIAKIAVETGIFRALSNVEKGSSLSLHDIAKATNVHPLLLARLLRFLTANDWIEQVTETAFAPKKVAETLSQPGLSHAIQHHFDAQLPAWLALPGFLASTSYTAPESAKHCAFQVGHSTTLAAFEWALMQPKLMSDFIQYMTAQRKGEESWLTVMNHVDLLGERVDQAPDNQVLLVDVGGGVGHQCRDLKAWLPGESRHRVVLQDLPMVVGHAGEIEGVEINAIDFWKDQPVKGAKFYYLRNVLHDYADEPCKTILKHIKDAMAPSSTIIIDELVLPDKLEKATTEAEVNACLDILLMASLGGQERTDAEWHNLLQCEGLVIQEKRQYDHRGHSVLIVQAAR